MKKTIHNRDSSLSDLLRNVQGPDFDAELLSEAMQAEMRKKTIIDLFRPQNTSRWIILRPVLGFGTALTIFFVFMLYPIDDEIHIRYQQAGNGIESSSISSRLLFNFNRTVHIPANLTAMIELPDGSMIDCQPQTQLEIEYDKTRSIHLYAGDITITAKPDANRPMIVETPVGSVRVVGTTFRVKTLHQ